MNSLQQAYSRALAVFIAVIVANWFAFSERYWIVLAAFFVMQTTIGATLRQGLQNYLLLISSLIIGSLLAALINNKLFLLGGVSIALSLGQIILKGKFIQNRIILLNELLPLKAAFSYLMVCVIIFLSILFPNPSSNSLYLRVYDLTMGAAIGIVINLFVFPLHVDVVFRKRMIPIFKLYSDYLNSIRQVFFKTKLAEEVVFQDKVALENMLQIGTSDFPTWVYESGLSFSLQSGYRHFIIMTERVGEILLSLHQIAKKPWQSSWLACLQESVDNYFSEVEKIFQALITVLNLQTLMEAVPDLKETLLAVEKAVDSLIPQSLDLIEMSNDYIELLAFVEQLKDLRITLLSLGNALRSAVGVVSVR